MKVPFPHCLSVVMRDLQSNSLQMLTQGTADIVLDCCDDFWDGKDLRSLGPQERKRAQVSIHSSNSDYMKLKSYKNIASSLHGICVGLLSTECIDRILYGVFISPAKTWYIGRLRGNGLYGATTRVGVQNQHISARP